MTITFLNCLPPPTAVNAKLPNSEVKGQMLTHTAPALPPPPSCLTSVSRSASSVWTLVLREVRATLMRVSLSISRVTFTSSRTDKAFSFAASKPSAMTLGWRPCTEKSRSDSYLFRHHFQFHIILSGSKYWIILPRSTRQTASCFKKMTHDRIRSNLLFRHFQILSLTLKMGEIINVKMTFD